MRKQIISKGYAVILFIALMSIGISSASALTSQTLGRMAVWNATENAYDVHYDLYVTDGYIIVPGWPGPVYVWGFTDVDPEVLNASGKLPRAPPGSLGFSTKTLPPATGCFQNICGYVGNAKFPAPVIEVNVTDNVYITVHNRGFYQMRQTVQDEHTIHLHGIHAQAQYDGFPESAGGYTEQMKAWWLPGQPMITNALSPMGGVVSARAPGLPTFGTDTNFTYYFKAQHAGTYMYHCHVVASEHVQMGMYGALIIRPMDFYNGDAENRTIYGKANVQQPDGTTPLENTSFDKEYIYLLSEFDTNWHKTIDSGAATPYYPPNWKPQLWFLNGRSFPDTVFPFQWFTYNRTANKWEPANGTNKGLEPFYNSYVNVSFGQTYSLRIINMGYQAQPLHAHGWHMKIVGKDARIYKNPQEMYTINVASGETWDVLVKADPVWGDRMDMGMGVMPAPQGSPMSVLPVNAGQPENLRQIFPIHSHDDYKVTTNGIYPGGALGLIEATGIPNSNASLPLIPNFGYLGAQSNTINLGAFPPLFAFPPPP